MLIPNGTDSKKEKNKQTQDIWVSNLEMGWNQHSHMLVWPVLGILLHRQENLLLSHYWLVNSGTRSYTEVYMIPMHMLSMCYHPASHIFATRVLSVRFLYPIHSHVMRIQLHFINWIQYPGTNSLTCALLPSWPTLNSVSLLPTLCGLCAFISWPLAPFITALCWGSVDITFLPWSRLHLLSVLSLHPGGTCLQPQTHPGVTFASATCN